MRFINQATFETLIKHMKIRKSILSFCEDFSNSDINCNLIIKPHPNENINFWKEFIKKLNDKRVKILVGKNIQDIECIEFTCCKNRMLNSSRSFFARNKYY